MSNNKIKLIEIFSGNSIVLNETEDKDGSTC